MEGGGSSFSNGRARGRARKEGWSAFAKMACLQGEPAKQRAKGEARMNRDRRHCGRAPQILRSDLYFAIFKVFSQAGIEIPFPQRDLHLRSISVPIPLTREAGRRAPAKSEAGSDRSQLL